jgi:hypothetical protein
MNLVFIQIKQISSVLHYSDNFEPLLVHFFQSTCLLEAICNIIVITNQTVDIEAFNIDVITNHSSLMFKADFLFLSS